MHVPLMFVFNESITSWLPSPLVIDYVDLKEKTTNGTVPQSEYTRIIGTTQNLE